MTRQILLIVILALVGDSLQNETSKELSDENIYSNNAEIYCQTQFVIKQNLLDDVENATNTYSDLVGDIKDIDCDAVLTEYMKKVYKKLRKDFKKKESSKITYDCVIQKMKEHGYDKMRLRFNALYGIEIESKKKDLLRSQINKEISDVIERSVDECWISEKNNY